ncbi:endonuclease/exonuclease/phosphatase family protein [Flavobacterium sp. NRK F10]|uniref:endonuclease/exonuclease/phosphatase family protein n=1 Tax=Flavobacterium sp. NRK F10 TaxID=2954931 RepID=UPI002090B7BC|nr:endonuclease/exonuclease/phosphatase family protein [Flavobacterium sp. NRK F10]MCO6175798.1 endonuclease/exonuclease/phosphatase family protein [Flavobacterium sp. NRK F10]
MKKVLFLFFCVSTLAFAQDDLNVMSYNVRLASVDDGDNSWEIRKERVARLIEYYEPDFLGMQEVQKVQLDFLLENLPQYRFIGLPREEGIHAEYSCIFYNAEKYKVLEEKTFWLSETPDEMSKGWDAACHRIVTYGLFQDKKSKQKFWIVNTHLDHVGLKAREKSAKILVQLAKELKTKKDIPFILTGDFNAEPNDTVIATLKEDLKEASSVSKTKPYGNSIHTWNAFQFYKIPDKQIDYIFFDKKTSIYVRKFNTINDFYDFKYPSDHLPILATFYLNYKKNK